MIGESRLADAHFSPDVYVIVDQGLAESRSIDVRWLAETIADAGAAAIQYRAKALSKAQYYQQVQSLLPVTRSRNLPLFVNDHLDVALAVSADGIHLGQDDLPLAAAKKLLPNTMMLGISTHSVAQAVRAAQAGVAYVAIGPIFPTTTKANPDPVVGVDALGEIKKLVGDVPVIAIGGIHCGNAAEVIRSGADAIAVASAVVLARDPAEEVKTLRDVVIRAREERTDDAC